MKNRDMVEEAREEEHEASTPGARDTEEPGGKAKRARGGGLDAAMEHKKKLHERKRGGKVPGKMAMQRPDKRARGGATSDMNPFTAAGKVSTPDYESKSGTPNGGGMGADKSPYGGGSHRRPG